MIRKRKNSKGQPCYQVIIRDNDGHPPKYETFPTMQEAKDWEVKEKARRRTEVYFPERINKKQTVGELIDKYIAEVLPSKPKSARDTERHLKWWKEKIGNLLVKTITADVIDKYCRNLKNGVTSKETARNAATVNLLDYFVSCRYFLKNPNHIIPYRSGKKCLIDGKEKWLETNQIYGFFSENFYDLYYGEMLSRISHGKLGPAIYRIDRSNPLEARVILVPELNLKHSFSIINHLVPIVMVT